jgi:phosphatidyl-myo-inositol alpha-mannosyltransferase
VRIGLVCPYSWDVPGGVQFHVRDLAEHFIRAGHEVSVLAPADDDTSLPDYLTSCGRPVPVRYNGSVARVTFGPATTARVNRWLEAGRFDVLHIHEPLNPSASLMALWASTEPVVATFHSAMLRSRALHAAHPLLRPSLEKIRGRIAVSEDARATV